MLFSFVLITLKYKSSGLSLPYSRYSYYAHFLDTHSRFLLQFDLLSECGYRVMTQAQDRYITVDTILQIEVYACMHFILSNIISTDLCIPCTGVLEDFSN